MIIPFLGTTFSGGEATNPKCGSSHSVPEAKGLSFFCRPPLYGRYVTIRSLKTKTPLTVCEVEVYSERRGIINVFSDDDVDGDCGGICCNSVFL